MRTIRLRRYAVTIMDNWTPSRTFWTLRSADRFYWKNQPASHLYKWTGYGWRKLAYTLVEAGQRKIWM